MSSPPAPPGGPDPVDWGTARRIARVVAGRDAIASSYLSRSLAPDFDRVTREAEELVAGHTGLEAPGRATGRVVDRSGWVDANVDSIRRMIRPFTERVGSRVARSALAPVGRQVAGTELGALLGFVAQRVLGQYDLLVLDEDGGDGDAVYYVGPNVLALEKRYAFRPLDFRRWIAIHEVTHRAQFTAVPWMRDYFLGLVRESMQQLDPDPRALAGALRRAADDLRAGRNPLDDGIVALVASPEQRVLLARIQALMSLLEGHGNVVMDELGARHVAGADRMARVLHARRNARGITGVIYRLLGFDLKLRQYEVGERFVRGVQQQVGPRALDAAWEGPEALPTLDEIAAPARWLARVHGHGAAAGASAG